jgi:hypothetical protein
MSRVYRIHSVAKRSGASELPVSPGLSHRSDYSRHDISNVTFTGANIYDARSKSHQKQHGRLCQTILILDAAGAEIEIPNLIIVMN